ncbi:MAG TPA: DNA repair protein RecN [candidate division Zixibacteria bacterium]|nr:DNA repair protein RecN [candidate division Zixibacteria bacterium]
MALLELSVENLAVLERVRLPLSRGFTVLTGETGAGKSLVVDALALALGARATADLVRAGTDAARVEAVFDGVAPAEDDPLADVLAAGDGMAIVRREVSADGRSLVRLNDRSVTVGSLAALGERLAEIHGQHEQQRLLAADRQLALLDRFGELDARRDAVAQAYRAWRSVVARSAELITDAHELARRVELLRHQVDEISAAAPRPGEDAELEARLRAATHAETIARAAAEAVRLLREDGGGLDALRLAATALGQAAAHDERFAELAARAEGLEAEATELGRDAADLGERVELDPAARAEAEERLSLLYDLKRKYGETLEGVLAFGQEAAAELERLEDQEGLRQRLRGEEERCRAALEEAAATLSVARAEAAGRLAERVNAELPPLGLPAGAFGVDLEPAELGPSGRDRAVFTFAPNPGEPPRPLARIASGGEASRLSLALKVVLAEADETPVLVFDEVDAGIGGRHATALGERLRALAAYHQVLCVTHLAQVAAFADTHVHIGKRVEGRRTVAEVTVLEGEARAVELAAMLAGAGAGEEARAAAEALLRAAAG